MITNESTTRSQTQKSTRVFDTVDQGNNPSAQSKFQARSSTPFHARTGHGPGVLVSGAALRRTPSARRALCATAVRRGNPPAAVLL